MSFFCTLEESTERKRFLFSSEGIDASGRLVRILFLLLDLWIFFDVFIAHLTSFLVHMGFLRTSAIPAGGWFVTGQCFGRTIQSIPCGCQTDTLCRLSSPPLLVFGADKPGVKPGQRQWWRGCDLSEFSNDGCVYQPDKKILWWAGVWR